MSLSILWDLMHAMSRFVCFVCAAVNTGVKRNENIGKLQAGYLFPEVTSLPIVNLAL